MKCTNTQYSLIVMIIILIMYYLYDTSNNSDNNTVDLDYSMYLNNNVNLENSMNLSNNNYNYSNNSTIIVNNTNNKNVNNVSNISNVNSNSSNLNNSNLNNIVVRDNSIYIDIKYILEDNSIKNVYTKGTIPENLDNVLIYTIKNILSSIIHINTFNLKDLERIYEEIDRYNNRRYMCLK